MKACVLKDKNNIVYEDVETPSPKKGEVLVKVLACGICSSDFNRVYKDSAYFFPIILGHEFSGQIVECGEGVEDSYFNKKVYKTKIGISYSLLGRANRVIFFKLFTTNCDWVQL